MKSALFSGRSSTHSRPRRGALLPRPCPPRAAAVDFWRRRCGRARSTAAVEDERSRHDVGRSAKAGACRPTGNCRCPVLDSRTDEPRHRTPAKTSLQPPRRRSTHPVGERRLLLLDGHSLAYRAFFALPAENFRTGTGQTTNAVYGFTAMLINLLRDEEPTHVAVAFDVSRDHLPLRAVLRLQGQPQLDARRLPRPGRPHQGRADGAGHPVLRGRQLRGRRHHRHARHAGRGAGVPGARHHGRPRRVPAGQRQRHGALPDTRGLRARPDRPRRGDDPLRAHARAVPRLRGAARRPQRQPAQHPGRRREDGRQVGARVRLAGGAHGPGGRGEGQGGRRPAREPRARAAEPPAHRADPRRPARGRPGRPRGPPVGPRRRAPAVRRARVPGAARAPVRHADQRRAGGGGGLRGRGRRARARHGAGLARRARPRRTPGRARRARAAGHLGGPRRRGDRAGGGRAVAGGPCGRGVGRCGTGGLPRRAHAAAGRRGGAGGVARRRVRAEGRARRQGGAARPARPRLGAPRA